MSIITIGIGLYFLFSAMVVVSICMISSRFSQQEGLTEEWSTQEQVYAKVPASVKQEMGKVTRYA